MREMALAPWSTLFLPASCDVQQVVALSRPLGLLLGLAVLAAAVVSLRLWRDEGQGDRATLAVVAATFAVGISAVASQLLRTPVALVANMLAILGFLTFVFVLIVHRLYRQSLMVTIVHVGGFFGATAMVAMVMMPRAFGHGAWFVVPLALVYILGASLVIRARLAMHDSRMLVGQGAARADRKNFRDLKTGYALLQAGVLIALGIVARTFDLKLCASSPQMLHAAWDGMIGLAVLVITFAVIRHLSRPALTPLGKVA